MKLSKTTDKLISPDYPYGYTLRTTKTDWIEFDPKRGFRHCSNTINPKTGRENKPKKSTYVDMLVLGKDESNGHTVARGFHFYAQKDIDEILSFMKEQENFALFTSEQIAYIYGRLVVYMQVDMKSQCIYCGSKPEDLIPLFDEQMKIALKGYKEKGVSNYFGSISFDWAKINSFKVPGFQPFKVVHHTT